MRMRVSPQEVDGTVVRNLKKADLLSDIARSSTFHRPQEHDKANKIDAIPAATY